MTKTELHPSFGPNQKAETLDTALQILYTSDQLTDTKEELTGLASLFKNIKLCLSLCIESFQQSGPVNFRTESNHPV